MHAEIEQAFSLNGRVAVITGAAGGIGREAAITFAKAGANVVIADVGIAGLEGTAELVRAAGGKVLVRRTDVSDSKDVAALASDAVREFGHLDIWANVAGIIKYFRIVDALEEDVRSVVDVNLLGVYWGVAAAARAMTNGGSIINITSAGGEIPAPTLSVYGMTKAGVAQLTRTAAAELGPSKIRVNAIAPGFIDTPMVSPHFTNAAGEVDPEAKAAILNARASQSPLGTTGEPTDITYAMLYLASEASRFMTGQTLRPNGGVFMA
jgi:3-oxoacyl-[acyl-carrier protein] reductase